jgi:hypothetical protein
MARTKKPTNVISLDEARIRAKLAMVEDRHQRYMEGKNPSPMAEAMAEYSQRVERTEQERKEKNQQIMKAYRIR